MSSPFLGLSVGRKMTIACGFLVVLIGVTIFASSVFTMLVLLPNQSVFATFPEENGKIVFSATRGDNQWDIYVMNANGTGQTSIANDSAGNSSHPDWGSTGAQPPSPPQNDTRTPVLTVPDNKVVEATSEDGAQVRYTVTARDNVDGNATLEDGKTVTQDNVGGNITMSCNPASGSTFPVGNTTVRCSATDAAGNTGEDQFTWAVNPALAAKIR